VSFPDVVIVGRTSQVNCMPRSVQGKTAVQTRVGRSKIRPWFGCSDPEPPASQSVVSRRDLAPLRPV
jgi:hypothetical protein